MDLSEPKLGRQRSVILEAGKLPWLRSVLTSRTPNPIRLTLPMGDYHLGKRNNIHLGRPNEKHSSQEIKDPRCPSVPWYIVINRQAIDLSVPRSINH